MCPDDSGSVFRTLRAGSVGGRPTVKCLSHTWSVLASHIGKDTWCSRAYGPHVSRLRGWRCHRQHAGRFPGEGTSLSPLTPGLAAGQVNSTCHVQVATLLTFLSCSACHAEHVAVKASSLCSSQATYCTRRNYALHNRTSRWVFISHRTMVRRECTVLAPFPLRLAEARPPRHATKRVA